MKHTETIEQKEIRLAARRFEKSCNKLLEIFCRKQEIDIDETFWIGGNVGGLVSFIDQYAFGMEDILHDLQTGQEPHFIFRWIDDGVDAHFAGIKDTINYKSYCMGARYDLLKKKD